MIRVFIDTDVLLDFFAEREPFGRETEEIMELSYEKQVELYCAASSYISIFRQLSESKGKARAVQALKDMKELLLTVAVDSAVIDRALENAVPELEESIQLECAAGIRNLHSVITGHPKHFRHKDILIQTPKEFLDAFNQTIHE